MAFRQAGQQCPAAPALAALKALDTLRALETLKALDPLKALHPLKALEPLKALVALIALTLGTPVLAAEHIGALNPVGGSATAMKEKDLPLEARRGDAVAVPLPFSNPTLDSGVVGVAGYFWPQTEAQAATQPASVTGLGVMYSGNGSYAVGVGHSAYWNGDTWRFTGALGFADVRLPLLAVDAGNAAVEVNWDLEGEFAYAALSRRIRGDWYLGFSARIVDLEQAIAAGISTDEFSLSSQLRTVGVGTNLVYDSRDLPSNPSTGQYLKLTGFANLDQLGSDAAYSSWLASLQSYHSLRPDLVLAWEAVACRKSSDVVLWDACTIGLRGFPSTEYMGKSSIRAQAELRWQVWGRVGLAAFAGAGEMTRTLSGRENNDTIPSYGVGLRFMVERAKRINLRLDFAQSRNNEAVYLSVGEAF